MINKSPSFNRDYNRDPCLGFKALGFRVKGQGGLFITVLNRFSRDYTRDPNIKLLKKGGY